MSYGPEGGGRHFSPQPSSHTMKIIFASEQFEREQNYFLKTQSVADFVGQPVVLSVSKAITCIVFYVLYYCPSLQSNPTLTDFKGLINFICYRRNFLRVGICYRRNSINGGSFKTVSVNRGNIIYNKRSCPFINLANFT